MAIEFLHINEYDADLIKLVEDHVHGHEHGEPVNTRMYSDMFRDFIEVLSNQNFGSSLYNAVVKDAYPMELYEYPLTLGEQKQYGVKMGIALESRVDIEKSELKDMPSAVDVNDVFRNHIAYKLARCALEGTSITANDVLHCVQTQQFHDYVLPYKERIEDAGVLHLPTAFKRYVSARLDDLESRYDLTDDEVRLKNVLESLPRKDEELDAIFDILGKASNFQHEQVTLEIDDFENELSNREVNVWLKDKATPDRNDIGFKSYQMNTIYNNRFIDTDYVDLLRYDDTALEVYIGDTPEEQMENRNCDIFNSINVYKDGFTRLLGQHGLTFEILADFNAYKAFLNENETVRNLVDNIIKVNDEAIYYYDEAASLVSINEQEMYQMESIAMLAHLKDLTNQFSMEELADIQKTLFGNYELKILINHLDTMSNASQSYKDPDLPSIGLKEMLNAIPDDFVNMALNLKDAPMALYHSDGYARSNMAYNENALALHISNKENPYILPIRDVSFTLEKELDSSCVRNNLTFTQDTTVLSERPATPSQLFFRDLTQEKIKNIMNNNITQLKHNTSTPPTPLKPLL